MTAALIIAMALVVVGALLYVHDRLTKEHDEKTETQPQEAQQEECCGMHIACEKDSLLASVSSEIVYYDDEELDAYKGRDNEAYSDDEIEQFRDVLLTMQPSDIAGWGRSLQLRGIALPQPVREELLMIVAEARAQKA